MALPMDNDNTLLACNICSYTCLPQAVLTMYMPSHTLRPQTDYMQLLSPDLSCPLCNKACSNRFTLAKRMNSYNIKVK